MDELKPTFGEEASSRFGVCRWYGEFNCDRSSRQDEFRESRSKSFVIPKPIYDVRVRYHTIHLLKKGKC